MRIEVGYDGSCPHSPKGVRRHGDAEWTIYPGPWTSGRISRKTEERGYRFEVRAVNPAAGRRPLTLHVDWGDEFLDSMKLRDIGYMKHDSDPEWALVIPSVRKAAATYRLTLKPGRTEIALWPAYNNDALDAFLASLAGRRAVRTSVAGKSAQGRPIHLIQIVAPGPAAGREQVVVQTRDHAYETAGNYCAEGMIAFLLSGDPVAGYFLQRFRFAFLPMTNPDGVATGMCRLTAPGGADLNRCCEQPDESWRTVKRTLERLRPNLYMNIHNWTYKWVDGLFCNSDRLMGCIRERMPSQGTVFKVWRQQSHADFLNQTGFASCPPEHRSWKNFVADNFNGQAVTFEFPWFGRSTADMRSTGRQVLLATLAAYLQLREN